MNVEPIEFTFCRFGYPGCRFADFEQHTSGFGSRMLNKMGFGGEGRGLGKDAHGIATPLKYAERAKPRIITNGFFSKLSSVRFAGTTLHAMLQAQVPCVPCALVNRDTVSSALLLLRFFIHRAGQCNGRSE